ncbi:MAG: hypothetical protein ACHRHE_08760, partial [Tepidisphaerales bacterium]
VDVDAKALGNDGRGQFEGMRLENTAGKQQEEGCQLHTIVYAPGTGVFAGLAAGIQARMAAIAGRIS